METTYQISCGYGKRDITPSLGHPITGYYEPRNVKGVIDPLFVRTVLFDNGANRAVLVSMDHIGLDKDLCTLIRERIGKAVSVHPDAVFINFSHTHTGPLVGVDFACDIASDPAYTDHMVYQCVCAAVEASQNMAPGKLYYAKTSAKGISFVRRYKLKDGTVKTNPGNPKFNNIIDYVLGEPDESLRLLKIVREDADDLYIVHFGTHADTVSGEYVCSDWPGHVCSTLEGAIPGSKCLCLIGCQGDVNHTNYLDRNGFGRIKSDRADVDYREQAAHARYMARVIAGNILAVCDKAEPLNGSDIGFGAVEVAVPVDLKEYTPEEWEEAEKNFAVYLEWFHRHEGDKKPTTTGAIVKATKMLRLKEEKPFHTFSVYALKLGDFVLAGLPGETFTDIGRQIYAGSPYDKMMVCCLTNAAPGYFPIRDAFNDGGYESNTTSYKIGSDEILVEGMKKLLNQL